MILAVCRCRALATDLHVFKLVLVPTEVTSVGDVIKSSLIARATAVYLTMHASTKSFRVLIYCHTAGFGVFYREHLRYYNSSLIFMK